MTSATGQAGGLYPLLLEPVIVDRIWGGTRMGELLHKGAPGGGGDGGPTRIGETWETAVESRIANGALLGRPLGELAREFGPALVGRRSGGTTDVPFPLLAKFIEAEAVLSVQVHPDDAYAQARLAQPYGKTEAWHIIDAAPGAVIYHGLRGADDRAAVRRALERGGTRDLLDAVPVRAGDTLFTPAGAVHAIGDGIILYEIQQYSDATFRLYDWDRRDDRGNPRELHLEQSLEVLDPAPATRHHTAPLAFDDRGARAALTACRYFALELLRPDGTMSVTLDGETFHLLAVLSGGVTITYPDAAPVEAGVGRSVLIPAAAGGYRLAAGSDCRLLRASVPDLQADIVAPLRARGIPDAEIAQLGGGWPDRNDLLPLLDAVRGA